MTMEETKDLIRRAKEGDEKAKERLVKENEGLIWSIVKRFSGRGYEEEDLFQTGAIGLIRCIDKFDFSYDVKFSTYAVPMIMGEIRRFLRDDGMIKVSRPLKQLAAQASEKRKEWMAEYGREPTIKQLAEALHTDIEELQLALDASLRVQSIHQPIGDDGGKEITILDQLSEKGETDEKRIDYMLLRDSIRLLDGKERQIILLRYFRDMTQSKVASLTGLTQVQVSRTEKKILNRLKQKFG